MGIVFLSWNDELSQLIWKYMGESTEIQKSWVKVCLIGLMVYVPVNSYGHVGMVSSQLQFHKIWTHFVND